MSYTPFTQDELRSAFATRRGTPDAIVAQRAAVARRNRVGIFAPEALARREEWLVRERAMRVRDDLITAQAEAWFVANQDRMVWIVGMNHDTPVQAWYDGAANVRLCTDPACCNGVPETADQRNERLSRIYDSGQPGDPDDMHYLGWLTGLS